MSIAPTSQDQRGNALFSGGDEGNRTPDIYLAKVALCQLSYVPEGSLQDSRTAGIFPEVWRVDFPGTSCGRADL